MHNCFPVPETAVRDEVGGTMTGVSSPVYVAGTLGTNDESTSLAVAAAAAADDVRRLCTKQPLGRSA